MDYFYFIIPLITMAVFLNVTTLLKRLVKNEDIRNERIVGSMLVVLLVLTLMIWITSFS